MLRQLPRKWTRAPWSSVSAASDGRLANSGLVVAPRFGPACLFAQPRACIHTSPEAPPSSAPTEAAFPPTLVGAANRAITQYPFTTALVYAYHNLAFCLAGSVALLAVGVPLPLELGPAMVINGVLRRLRMPLILGASAAVIRVWPSLGQLRLTTLLAAPLTLFLGLQPPSVTAPVPALPPNATLWQRTAALARSAWAFVNPLNPTGGVGPLLDRYGLAYILCARALSTASLLAITAALRYGVDLPELLASWGLGDAVAADADSSHSVVAAMERLGAAIGVVKDSADGRELARVTAVMAGEGATAAASCQNSARTGRGVTPGGRATAPTCIPA
jgi:hypothetical protein